VAPLMTMVALGRGRSCLTVLAMARPVRSELRAETLAALAVVADAGSSASA
jgi:hypothetical protein